MLVNSKLISFPNLFLIGRIWRANSGKFICQPRLLITIVRRFRLSFLSYNLLSCDSVLPALLTISCRLLLRPALTMTNFSVFRGVYLASTRINRPTMSLFSHPYVLIALCIFSIFFVHPNSRKWPKYTFPFSVPLFEFYVVARLKLSHFFVMARWLEFGKGTQHLLFSVGEADKTTSDDSNVPTSHVWDLTSEAQTQARLLRDL